MSKPNRAIVITALLAAAAAWMSSASAQQHDIHASKLSVVRDHFQAGPQQEEWTYVANACERAAALESVVVDAEGEILRIRLDLTGSVPYRVRFDSASCELRVDLSGTVALANAQTLLMNAGTLVNGVAAQLSSVSPVIVSRVTIGLTAPVAVTTSSSGDALVIEARPAEYFQQPVSETAAQESAMLAALLSETESAAGSSVADANALCSAKIGALQTAIAGAEVALLEQGLTGIASADDLAMDAGSTQHAAALHADCERFAAAQRKTLDERSALRVAASRVYGAGTSAEGTNEDTNLAIGASFDSIAESIVAMEADAARSLRSIAEAAEARTGAATALALETAAAADAPSLEPGALFAQLDGAFGELRGEEAAGSPLTTLDTALAEIGAAELKLDIGSPVLGAVKNSTSTVPTAMPAPVRRELTADTFGADADSISAISTAQRTNDEPIRFAQSPEDISFSAPRAPTFELYRAGVPADQDPLQQPVTIDFRDMDLLNVVSLLAEKGEINVIAGTEVRGTVTASLKDIPLGRAIETVLRMNGLGIIEESGVYRITTYEEAIESRRETRIIFLQNVDAEEVEKTIDQSAKGPDASRFQVSSNEETNTVVLSGPSDLVNQMAMVVEKLDVTEQTIPSVTKVFKLNHAVPKDLEEIVESILTGEGEVDGDIRSRQLVVTDTPGKMRDIEDLVAKLDSAVKQVAIEATIADVTMDDRTQTGIDWLIQRLPDGNVVDPTNVGASLLPAVVAGTGALSLLTGDFDINVLLAAEVSSNNAQILANPVLVTVENTPATISIAEEIPFRQAQQTESGGLISSVEFKDVGTVLTVTPRINFDNQIVVALQVKQSNISGFTPAPDPIPIEDVREVETTLRIEDGQSVFIGGLRKFQDSVGAQKVPLLGNIPVLGFFFGNRDVSQDNLELLVFLTCNVINAELPELTPYQQERYDDVSGREMRPNADRTMVESYIHPEIYRDPFYKWRRDK